MASGREVAEFNWKTFTTWLSAKTDEDFRAMASRGVLARKEIAKECGFAKSALDQNPRIKGALRAKEEELRSRGILPLAARVEGDEVREPLLRDVSKQKALMDADRLRRLEEQNAALRAEVAELRRHLERFAVLREALALTGRVPR